MHQTNSSFSSSSLSSFPAPLNQRGFDPTVSLGRLQTLTDILDRYLRLPTSPRAFFLYLAALILVSAGATLYVLISAQIHQARVQLVRLDEQLATVEQQNGDILWKIARETNMKQLHARITAADYVQVEAREYVVVTGESAPAVVHSQSADPAPQSLASTSAVQSPPAAWQSFLARRGSTTQGVTTGPIRLPAASDAGPTADQWRLWWEEALDRGAIMLRQFTGR